MNEPLYEQNPISSLVPASIDSNSLAPPESFATCYQKFTGFALEEQPYSGDLLLYGRPKQKSPQYHPLVRTGLLGAGSLAATIAIGFLLSDRAGSQLNVSSQDHSPQLQPGSNLDPQSLNLAPSSLPESPTTLKSVEFADLGNARRPFRELLAEQLGSLKANNSAPRGIQPTPSTAKVSPVTQPDADQKLPLLKRGNSLLQQSLLDPPANSPRRQLRTAIATSTQLKASVASQSAAVNLSLSGVAPEWMSGKQPASTHMAPSLSQPDSATVASIAAQNSVKPKLPESLTASGSTTLIPGKTIASLRTIDDFINLPRQISTSGAVKLLPLTTQAAAEISSLNSINNVPIVRLSSEQYRQLWVSLTQTKALEAKASESAPASGFIDYQQQVIVLPAIGENISTSLNQ